MTDAERLMRMALDACRADLIAWLIKEKKFTPKGAERAARSFIDTMVFLARETGENELLRADNDWLRNEMATNMIYKKEADELRAEIERLRREEAEVYSEARKEFADEIEAAREVILSRNAEIERLNAKVDNWADINAAAGREIERLNDALTDYHRVKTLGRADAAENKRLTEQITVLRELRACDQREIERLRSKP